MVDGSIKKVLWDAYLSPNFSVRPLKNQKWTTCGTPIISMITGESPDRVEAHCPRPRDGWHTRTLKKYLQSRGYTVVDVTKNSVTNVHWERLPIQTDHLLVLSAQVDTESNSWFLLHDNKLYHNNYQEKQFNSMFFLNKPTKDVMCVFHENFAGKKRKKAPTQVTFNLQDGTVNWT